MTAGQSPFRARKERAKWEEVEMRVREQVEEYSDKFTEDTKDICQLVSPGARHSSASNAPEKNIPASPYNSNPPTISSNIL
eukprot:g31188.t1